ncbi:MAG: CvpA family protein [Candidatus Omnitrophota bacterium]
MDIFKQINWVDIFFLILLLRICYVSLKNGMPIEFFKLLGTIAATYLSLHYYVALASFLSNRFLKGASLQTLSFLSFLVLAIAGYAAFFLLRQVFFKLIKVEPLPGLNKWAGVIFGLLRGLLFLSLVLLVFAVSPLGYLKKSAADSYSGKPIFKIAPRVYEVIWNGIFCKFATSEKFNSAVGNLQNLDTPEK